MSGIIAKEKLLPKYELIISCCCCCCGPSRRPSSVSASASRASWDGAAGGPEEERRQSQPAAAGLLFFFLLKGSSSSSSISSSSQWVQNFVHNHSVVRLGEGRGECRSAALSRWLFSFVFFNLLKKFHKIATGVHTKRKRGKEGWRIRCCHSFARPPRRLSLPSQSLRGPARPLICAVGSRGCCPAAWRRDCLTVSPPKKARRSYCAPTWWKDRDAGINCSWVQGGNSLLAGVGEWPITKWPSTVIDLLYPMTNVIWLLWQNW